MVLAAKIETYDTAPSGAFFSSEIDAKTTKDDEIIAVGVVAAWDPVGQFYARKCRERKKRKNRR